MTHQFLTLLVAVAALLGCQSLNVGTTTITHTNTNIGATKANESDWLPPEEALAALPSPPSNAASATAIPSTVQLCPVFRAPVVPPPPALPYKELERIGPGNPARIDELQRRHIEDLRNYLNRTRRTMAAAYARYLEECKAFNTPKQ
jgi:hypothetical protein